jgi:hypothetical protein
MEMNVRSGREVGRILERAAEQVRGQLGEHADGVRQLDVEMNELLSQRSETLLELARHYLPDLNLETIQNSFVEVREELLQLLLQKQRRQTEVQDQVSGAAREAEHQEAELDRVTDELNAKVAERERLEALVADRLHATPEFTALSQQALDAEGELNRNEARVAEIEEDAREKLPSYERSRLFTYLRDAGYGTARYQAGGLTRRLDGWIAKMIDFDGARRGYHFLRTTPQLMKQEVARRRDRFNELMQQVEAIEDRVSDELGLTEVLRLGQQLGVERDRLVEAVSKAQTRVLQLQHQLAQLEGRQNEFYEQAIIRLRAFLERLPEARLQRHSQSTPQPDDDALVAEVAGISDRLEAAEGRGAELERVREAWDRRFDGLQQLLQRFRQAEFDSQRSLFPRHLDVEDLIENYLAGRISSQQTWDMIQHAQRFAPTWNEQQESVFGEFPVGDVSMVLLKVLSEVAGAAMQHSAGRGMQRRGPMRHKSRQASGRPHFPRGGFTNGRGF